jgi:hypothetical protein
MTVEPWLRDSTTCRADCRAGSMFHSFFSRRSFSILSIRLGPAWFVRQPMRKSDLYRWACASTNPGRMMALSPSSTGVPSAMMPGAMRVIRPLWIRMSVRAAPQGRTFLIGREFFIVFVMASYSWLLHRLDQIQHELLVGDNVVVNMKVCDRLEVFRPHVMTILVQAPGGHIHLHHLAQ